MKKMRSILTILFSALVALTMTTGDVLAQAGGITKSGTGLKVGWSWPDSISSNYSALFPTFAEQTIGGSYSATDTIYVNDFYTSVVVSPTLTGVYALSLFAAPHLTGGGSVYVSIKANDQRVVTLNGNADGLFTTDSLKRQVAHLFFDGSEFKLAGVGNTE